MATIRLEIYLLLLCCSLNFAIGGDCPASAPTVAIVDKCPTNETEMEKAAQRKKCDMMKGVENCDQPPVYHCLLNQWGNATVEVCTSPWYISGFCTIYNTEQMKVMDDFNRDCTKFSEGKCPSRYHSPEAYMYERCYRIRTSSNPITCHQQSNGSDYKAGLAVLGIIIVLLLVLIIILILDRQGIIQKIGLLIRTCREKNQDGNSAADLEESRSFLEDGLPIRTRREEIEDGNSAADLGESQSLLENEEDEHSPSKKPKENGLPGRKPIHGSKDNDAKPEEKGFKEKRDIFESPQKHNQNEHSGYSKRENTTESERKNENKEVHGDLTSDEEISDVKDVDAGETSRNHEVCEALSDKFWNTPRTKNLNSQKDQALPKLWKGDVDKKHFQNAEETKSADDNNSVNGHDQYTDTDQEKTRETAKSDIDVDKGEDSKENEESKVPVQETDHSNHTTDSVVIGSRNEEQADQLNKDTDLDKSEETVHRGLVAQRCGQFETPK